MFPRNTLLSAVLLSFLPGLVLSLNDWSVPCVHGDCSYDTEYASVTINGPPGSISDITEAGGWTIVDCDPDAVEQSIRLVCSDETNCANLNINGKAHQLVRLPEWCGKGPFVRIARLWVSKDQQLPEKFASKLVRRDGTLPEVMAMNLDVDFERLDSSAGEITFKIHGANIPGLSASIFDAEVPARVRRSRVSQAMPHVELLRRGIFDKIGDIKDKVEEKAGDIKDKVEEKLEDLDEVSIDETTKLPTVNINQSFPLFQQGIECADPANPSVTTGVGISASLNAQATADIRVGIVAEGSLSKAESTKFGLVMGLNAELNGSLDFDVNVNAQIDSGKIDLISISATAAFDINAKAKLGLSYKIKDAEFVFPKNDKDTSGFEPADDVIEFAVGPSISTAASVSAHMIPRFNVGVSVFGKGVNIFTDLDASATAALSLTAGANAAGIFKKEIRAGAPEVVKKDIIPSGESIASDIAKRQSTSVNGGIDVFAQLDVNVGADAYFFGLFNQEVKLTLFTKKFELFKKCFNEGAEARKRAYPRRGLEPVSIPRLALPVGKRALSCLPTGPAGVIVDLINTKVNAADKKAA
ncbi:hypothetical protein BDV98DRAFT_576836 [Pterulicium gracile]|uniref:Uncharacterized protein n=1 Tax=Pterulicium gracile TaxID=1884261 RepID=A0A5C3Q4E5_9AGAR|nr:hypothetical protein BDV98DRAFT_576836 [Pterula gracilis]